MSKFGKYIATSQTIAGTAAEEASRWSHPAIDVDHLLLALATLDDAAGRVLRAHGGDLATLRQGVEHVHAARIASLGLRPPASPARRPRNPASTRMSWTPRALALTRATTDYSCGLELLSVVLEEKSGLAGDVLAAADIDVAALRAAVGRERLAARTKLSARRTVQATGHIPAPTEQVWSLVSDPARRAEWDPEVDRVAPADDGTFELWLPERRPDGKPSRVRPRYRRAMMRVIETSQRHAIEWETWWPQLRQPAARRTRIELAPDGQGTSIIVTIRPRNDKSRWPAPARPLLAPLGRLVNRHRARWQVAGISRACR